MADDRLDEQPRRGAGDPQDGEIVELGAQRLEDAAGIDVLQAPDDLDAEQTEAHVPDLQQAEPPARGPGTGHGVTRLARPACLQTDPPDALTRPFSALLQLGHNGQQ
jgi:hypothetical protein